MEEHSSWNWFQKPGYISTVPPLVYTPWNGDTCGLYMEVGKEYLLASKHPCSQNSLLNQMHEAVGTRHHDGSLHVYLCGQVTDSGFGGVSEWNQVSPALRANLTTFQCWMMDESFLSTCCAVLFVPPVVGTTACTSYCSVNLYIIGIFVLKVSTSKFSC